MIFCVFTTFSETHTKIIDILQKNFPCVLLILNKPENIDYYLVKNKSSINNIQHFIYSTEQELNNYYTGLLTKGYTLVVNDNESIKLSNKQSYSIYIKIQENNQLFIETAHFKKRGLCTEDFLTDVIIESFKNGHINLAFRYKDINYLIKGSPNQPMDELPLLNIQSKYSTPTASSSTIKVLPITNWTAPNEFINHLNRFKPSDSNVEFVLTNQPDYALVVNESHYSVNPKKTIYFMMEPNGETLYENYLKQFNTPQTRLLFKGDHKHHLNLQEYWLNKTVNELLNGNIEKTHDYDNILSVCVSDRYVDPGHKYRIDLIKKLDEGCGTKYPIQIHIYGKCKSLQFKNYKGECPERDKSNALMKYKYHFNAENHQIDNYITEKFNDPLMSECYLFYHGAKNASSYFKNNFTNLSGDIDTDIQTIVKEITEKKWDTSIQQIREQKTKAILTQNTFYRLESIITFSKTIFIRIFNTDTPQPVDIQKYQDNGWNLIAACLFKLDTEYKYLESVLSGSNAIENKFNIILSFQDNFDTYDQFMFQYLLKTKTISREGKKPDLILLDTNPELKLSVENYFNSSYTVFIPYETQVNLLNRLREGKRTTESLFHDLIIA